jgi:hypothetical protein
MAMQDARDLVDQTVLVKLTGNEGLSFIGVPEDGPFFCTVTAVDEIGIWVENKRFAAVEIKDAQGRYIPKRRRKIERHEVDILLPWRIIQTLIRFREEDAAKAAADELGADTKSGSCIGFVR